MNILHISDNALGLPYPLLADKPENLAKQVFDKHVVADLFLINVNYITENITRADNAGILSLKYLRLNHLNQHCVLYSFLSREQMMSLDPRNLIIFSKGVSFIHLPEELSRYDFQALAQKKAPEDFSGYFRGEIRLPEDERHNWANFWGIHRLWMVHKYIDTKFKDINVEDLYCNELKEKVNSYNGKLLRYLYNHKDNNIINSLNEQADSIDQHFGVRIKPKITQIDGVFDEINKINEEDDNQTTIANKINEIKRILNLNNDDPLSEILSNITIDLFKTDNEKMIDDIKSEILDYLKVQQFKNIEVHRQELKEKNPSIIFIDDQANLGWADIFQEIIYGDKSPNFNVIAPKHEESVEIIQKQITEKITELTEKAEPPQLIMIDMRLKGEEGFIKIEEISGIQVLNYILKHFPKIPVMVVTASNKARFYIHIKDRNHSPRGFWIKEGIDSRFNEKESVNNYTDFVFQLNNLIKKKDDYSRREKVANTVRNALNKEKALEKIHLSKALHYYTEEEINRITETTLFKESFSDIIYNNLIIDANYFCNPKTSYVSLKDKNEIVTNLQSFILLAGIYTKLGKGVIIPYKAFQEIVKHGMTITNYANPNIAARFSFQMLKQLYNENKISIECNMGFSQTELPDVLSTKDTYADPDIKSLFINLRDNKPKNNIALITDDRGLRDSIINYFKDKNTWCRIIWSNEMNKKLKPLIEFGETLYEDITDNQST